MVDCAIEGVNGGAGSMWAAGIAGRVDGGLVGGREGWRIEEGLVGGGGLGVPVRGGGEIDAGGGVMTSWIRQVNWLSLPGGLVAWVRNPTSAVNGAAASNGMRSMVLGGGSGAGRMGLARG